VRIGLPHVEEADSPSFFFARRIFSGKRFRENDLMRPEIPEWVYVVFTAATSIGVLMQACILLGMFIGLRRLQNRIENILNHMTDYALPLIASSKTTLEELTPKLKTITNNLVDVSETLKSQSQNVSVSVEDVLEKTRAQTARVDEMVSGTLDGLSHAGTAIQHGIELPLRHLNGLVNGLRAGLGVLRGKAPEPAPASPEAEVVLIVEEAVEARSGL
jgi:hypothetical protein